MNEDSGIDRKRLYKNSIKLYLRTFYTLAVGLYNSRVVLEVLGIDDFGVYSLVGSITALFFFFYSSMSSALSRFMSYELTNDDGGRRLADTFGTAMVIVSGIAALILLVGEGLGHFALDKLNIPEGSEHAAAVVYQFSLATIVVMILQVCYMSVVIARERMGVFAIVDMTTTTLKLAAIFALKYIASNKLELYAGLVFGITLVTTILTIVYCRKHFPECRSGFVWQRKLFGTLLTYSGWNLFKTLCDTLRPAGINVVTNLFFGVVVNGAIGIAANVSSNLNKFTANVYLAFKPQIIKAYALKAYGDMASLLSDSFRFSTLVLGMIVITLILEMPYVLTLWLGECPEYAAIFCRLLCVAMFFEVVLSIIEFGINATGKIRTFCLVNGILTVSTVLFGWLAFSEKFAPPTIYIIQLALDVVCVVVALRILVSLIPALSVRSILRGTPKIALGLVGVFAVCLWIHLEMAEGFLRFFVVGCADVVLLGLFSYFWVLPPSMRAKVKSKVLGKSRC